MWNIDSQAEAAVITHIATRDGAAQAGAAQAGAASLKAIVQTVPLCGDHHNRPLSHLFGPTRTNCIYFYAPLSGGRGYHGDRPDAELRLLQTRCCGAATRVTTPANGCHQKTRDAICGGLLTLIGTAVATGEVSRQVS